MSDDLIERELRTILRAEGDSVPLTITASELERRLARRRRESANLRFRFVTAAVAVVAVGSLVAFGNGWVRLPTVGGVIPTPIASPVSSPASSPAGSTRSPLGPADQAILVRLVGDPTHPDAFEVTRFDPASGSSSLIASVPWTILPSNVSVTDVRAPSISTTGWLAIPFNGAGNVGGNLPLLAIVDVTDPAREPWIVDGSGSNSWNDDEHLVVTTYGGLTVDDPLTRRQSFLSYARDSLIVDVVRQGIAWSTEPRTTLVARRVTVAKPVWGSIDSDGVFTESSDLPPVYQRLGLERPAGDGAHSVGQPCNSFGSASPDDCSLVETDADGTPVGTRLDAQDAITMLDHVWAADGHGLWLLMDTGGGPVTLEYARPEGDRDDIARIDLSESEFGPAIVGIASETEPGKAVVAIGNATGQVLAFVTHDGSVTKPDGAAWFAGWAGDQPVYDPD